MRARDTLHVANLEAQGYSHFCKLTPFTGKLARVQGFYSCFFLFFFSPVGDARILFFNISIEGKGMN